MIALAAVVAPILSELTGALAIPEIVIQIGLGIVGPYVLNLADVTNIVTGLSDLGLTFLIFLAGYELDLRKIRGKPLQLATAGCDLPAGRSDRGVRPGLFGPGPRHGGGGLGLNHHGSRHPGPDAAGRTGSGHPVRGLHLGHRANSARSLPSPSS